MLVENSTTYTLNSISRDAAGELKCSLVVDEKMEASQNVVVSCKYILANAHLEHHERHEHPCWNRNCQLSLPGLKMLLEWRFYSVSAHSREEGSAN